MTNHDGQTRKSDHHVKRQSSQHHVSCDELEALRRELDKENENRNQAQSKYTDLNRQMDIFEQCCDEAKNNPESKYDAFIVKQNCLNEQLHSKIRDTRDSLTSLTHTLKSTQTCGKACSVDCNLNMKDLCIDYNCISKTELTKEVKRFERMQIDLKSTLDRMQWRLDSESKSYYNLVDQFQKLQIELYYLQNLSDRYSHKGMYM